MEKSHNKKCEFLSSDSILVIQRRQLSLTNTVADSAKSDQLSTSSNTAAIYSSVWRSSVNYASAQLPQLSMYYDDTTHKTW